MLLHDVHDLPQEEVGAILGIPVGTVKSRLHRGRVALAKALHVERERGRSPGPSDGTVAR
jgi:DNA-directed RNA polymerase specialized sigma24 family protein